MAELHWPKVRITTPTPTPKHPWTPTVLTSIEVDGQVWPITDYKIDGRGINGTQTVTLVFEADLTIVHPEATDA